MKKWRAKIKEKDKDHILTPEYWFSDENEKTRKNIIDFWGLENPDVEWYKLELFDDEDKKK